MRVLITTVPFGEINRLPLDLLEQAGIDYLINPTGRKLKEHELADMVGDFDVIIAGTEPITARVMERAPRLRLISRVGIGLDSVDLLEAQKRQISVSYTPDAPAPAVAELTIGLMVSLLRHTQVSDREIRQRNWRRFMGRRLSNIKVGILGMGRIGKGVTYLLQGFAPQILANDLQPDPVLNEQYDITWTDKKTIYQEADLITVHLPLTGKTRNLIASREMAMMKPDALLINTARGGIINEEDLALALKKNQLGGAAIDVFMEEPYYGELINEKNCILTSHMGSMSQDCRYKMELEATKEAIRFIRNEPVMGSVPDLEYDIQKQSSKSRQK
ncbi:MAG: phosphoglycerate dehydrogenase [Magnetococcales bacterium]|nr:phosphoglycerate dehydrogenase [Magnetococcales bacterium]